MKILRTVAILTLCLGLLYSTTSCVVLLKKDNGKHNGWNKNGNQSNGNNSEKSRGKHNK